MRFGTSATVMVPLSMKLAEEDAEWERGQEQEI